MFWLRKYNRIGNRKCIKNPDVVTISELLLGNIRLFICTVWQLNTARENNIIIGASLNVHHNIYRSLDLLTENCPKYVNYSSHIASISKLNLIVFPCFYFQEAGRIKTKSNINEYSINDTEFTWFINMFENFICKNIFHIEIENI